MRASVEERLPLPTHREVRKKKEKAKGPSDKELVHRLKESGDLAAFEELVNRYEAKVYHLALRLTGNREDAEEVLQDTFLQVYEKIRTFREEAAFSSWLYRVTANFAYMKLRRRRSRPQVSFEDVMPYFEGGHLAEQITDWSGRPDDEAVRAEAQRIILEAIDELPPKNRTVFVLREMEGLSNAEVAEVLGITVPAVKSRLHWARLFLRKRLAQYFGATQP